jgi:hypothetical protein
MGGVLQESLVQLRNEASCGIEPAFKGEGAYFLVLCVDNEHVECEYHAINQE